jgi:CRP-like cAMP-binding protein
MVSGGAQNKLNASLFKDVKLLQKFSAQEMDALLSQGKVHEYEAHANIVIEGESSWGLYLILDGVVGIFKANKLSGEVYDVGQLRAGNFFGEMSLVDENPRSATVRALTDCKLFFLSKETFMGFLNRSTDLKLRFYENCLKDMISRLRDLGDSYVISQYQLWKTAIKKDAA